MTVKQFFAALAALDRAIYTVKVTGRFDKSLARSYKRDRDLSRLFDVVSVLAMGEPLHPKFRAHTLHGLGERVWECHIQPDWLLVWTQNDDELILVLLDTGSHADLF